MKKNREVFALPALSISRIKLKEVVNPQKTNL
jgi:hypothetical protein